MESFDSKTIFEVKNQIRTEFDIKSPVKKVELKIENYDESQAENTQKSRKKKHECNICSKSFQTPALLGRHKMIHSNERPFKCESCEKDFKQKSNLSHHLKIHSGEKHKSYTGSSGEISRLV